MPIFFVFTCHDFAEEGIHNLLWGHIDYNFFFPDEVIYFLEWHQEKPKNKRPNIDYNLTSC